MVVIAAFQSITMEVWASSSHTRYSRIVQLYIDILYLSIAFPTLSILSYKTFWVSRNWPWQGNGKLFTDTAERFVGKGKGTVEQSCGDSEFDSQQEFCWVQGGSWRFFILGFETESSTRSSEAAPWWKVRVRFGTAASCQDNSGWSWDGRRCSERRRTILQCRRCNSCLPVMSCVSVCVCESSYVYSRVFLHMSIIHEHSKPCHLDLLTHKVQACCVLYGSFFMGKMLRQYNVFDFYHKKVHKFAPL